MTLKDLLTLMETGTMDKCISALKTHCLVKSLSDAVKQYDPAQHNVMDKTKREDKFIYDDVEGDDGKLSSQIVDTVPVARIPLALQKKIVVTTAAFLGNPSMDARPNYDVEENMLAGLNRIWEDNKLDYKFRDVAKTTMSRFECAELWFNVNADKDYWDGTGVNGIYKQKVLILSSKKGDILYPVFDEYGDMVAFGREYKIKDIDGKEIQHLDIYTAEKFYYSKNGGDNIWLFGDETDKEVYTAGFKGVKNEVGKIPVAYAYQPYTEWQDVQWLIERLEEVIGNLADTNDYAGSPIMFAENADELSFPKKGETGKVIQGKGNAKISYITYDNQPKSVQMEIDNLVKYIFSLTHTPDIAFENLKGLGYFATMALKTIFLDAHIKAMDKEEIFGEFVQRRINYLKKFLITIDNKLKPALNMKIKPKFDYLLPKDINEIVTTLNSANKAGQISNDTMVRSSPLVTDPESELQKLKKQREKKRRRNSLRQVVK